MRVSSLLLIGVGSLVPLTQATNIYYRPAAGYYRCPEAEMVCNVIGCEDNNCSILTNGFDVVTVGDKTVYTSTGTSSDISITGDDASAIDCDVACECQSIIPGTGCNVPISSRSEDPFEGGVTDATGTVSKVNIDNSSANTVALGGSLVLSALVSLVP